LNPNTNSIGSWLELKLFLSTNNKRFHHNQSFDLQFPLLRHNSNKLSRYGEELRDFIYIYIYISRKTYYKVNFILQLKKIRNGFLCKFDKQLFILISFIWEKLYTPLSEAKGFLEGNDEFKFECYIYTNSSLTKIQC